MKITIYQAFQNTKYLKYHTWPFSTQKSGIDHHQNKECPKNPIDSNSASIPRTAHRTDTVSIGPHVNFQSIDPDNRYRDIYRSPRFRTPVIEMVQGRQVSKRPRLVFAGNEHVRAGRTCQLITGDVTIYTMDIHIDAQIHRSGMANGFRAFLRVWFWFGSM